MVEDLINWLIITAVYIIGFFSGYWLASIMYNKKQKGDDYEPF